MFVPVLVLAECEVVVGVDVVAVVVPGNGGVSRSVQRVVVWSASARRSPISDAMNSISLRSTGACEGKRAENEAGDWVESAAGDTVECDDVEGEAPSHPLPPPLPLRLPPAV